MSTQRKLQALGYGILPEEGRAEGAGKRCSECARNGEHTLQASLSGTLPWRKDKLDMAGWGGGGGDKLV